jgi:hypothetical protein
MKVSEQEWMAYVDGELDATAAARVEAAMRADPELAALVATQQRLRARLQQAFAPVLEEPVPIRLSATAARAPRRLPMLPPTWLAAAASLALGVLLASWWHGRVEGPLQLAGGNLVAGAGLADALDHQLAAEGGGRPVAVGLSFRSRAGNYCRSFVLAGQSFGPQSLAGLACHDAGSWRVVALGEATPRGGELRQASSSLPPAVLAEVDARLQGEPLDAASERQARDASWR